MFSSGINSPDESSGDKADRSTSGSHVSNDQESAGLLPDRLSRQIRFTRLKEIRSVLADGATLPGTNTRIEPFVFQSAPGERMAAENAGLEGFLWTEHQFKQNFGNQASARLTDDYISYALAVFDSTPGCESAKDALLQLRDPTKSSESKYTRFISVIHGLVRDLREEVQSLDEARWIRDIRSYQIFLRAFNLEGRRQALDIPESPLSGKFFADLNEDDLRQLKSIGFSAIRFMGTYPIGQAGRKGSGGGSPFAVVDHVVSEEHGDKDDVRQCMDLLHRHGFKSVFELVLNHTAIDSTLAAKNPTLFVHTKTEPQDKGGYHHVTHPDHGDVWIRFGGYRDDRVGGREYWKDTLQLDLTNPETRTELIEITKRLIRDYGVDALRVDMAYQMLNSYFLHNWQGEVGNPGSQNEFLDELITAVKSEFPSCGFVAEGYGKWDELSQAGFDLIYGFNSMTRLGGHKHHGWHESLKSRDPQEIRGALERVAFLEWQRGGAGMAAFLGTHDNPSPTRVFGDFVWGASALTFLKPGAFLFLGGTGARFEAPDPGDGKMITFESPVTIDWSGLKSDFARKTHDLLALSGLMAHKFKNAAIMPLPNRDGDAPWVGYAFYEDNHPLSSDKIVVVVNTAPREAKVLSSLPELGISRIQCVVPPLGPGGFQVILIPGDYRSASEGAQ